MFRCSFGFATVGFWFRPSQGLIPEPLNLEPCVSTLRPKLDLRLQAKAFPRPVDVVPLFVTLVF